MKRNFTAIERSTGRVMYRGSADNPNALADADTFIRVGVTLEDGWVDERGRFHALPAKPVDADRFDWMLKRWVPRTADQQWRWVRAERSARLAASDWTQGADVPEQTRTRWQPYRQALRDITLQSLPVVWPTPPQ